MKISVLNSRYRRLKNVNDRLGIIALAEKCKLQSLFYEMDSEKDYTAFYTFHRIKLSDSGIWMFRQVIFKTSEITSNTAGFVNFKFLGNIFSGTHAYSAGHINGSGSEKPMVYIGIQGSFRFHEFISVVNRDMVQGLTLLEKGRHHIIKLL